MTALQTEPWRDLRFDNLFILLVMILFDELSVQLFDQSMTAVSWLPHDFWTAFIAVLLPSDLMHT